jgi:DNA-binding NtrC family response regulator
MRDPRDADRATETADDAPVPTLRRRSFRPIGPCSFELVVIEGPDAGKRVKVDPGATCVLVGKSPLCALRLEDPAVAPRQCSLEVVDGRLHVVDLSGSGTRVNGVIAREVFLHGGELVRIGESVLCALRTEDERSGVFRREVTFGRFRGDSLVIRKLFPVFATLLQSRGPILIEGEAGVGKRLLAEEIHRHAAGSRAPFSEFLERGASAERIDAALFASGGLYDQARGGTLFIKELLDLDEDAQRKLADLIRASSRESEARRVRVIAATRECGRALQGELGARFGNSRVTLPPLRAREGDVLLLARAFWTELGGEGSLPDDVIARLTDRSWPGNVRELRIAVSDVIRHGNEDGGHGSARHRDTLSKVIESDLPFVDARNAVLAEFEKRYVDRALARSGRNVSRAAAASGIAHRYFQVLRSRYRSA